jgi:hypothetical protein
MLPQSGREIDTSPDADAQRRRTWLPGKSVRPLGSSFLVGVLVWAVLDLAFGITFSSVARYLLPPVVLLCLVLSILDYDSDG